MWYIWLFLFLIFLGVEMITPGVFFFLCFSVGAVFAMATSLLGFSYQTSIIVFCIVSAISIFFIRPLLKKYMESRKIDTNVDALIGTKTQLLESISAGQIGKVKVEGEIWSAVSDNGEDISAGTTVEIVSVDGTKLIVRK
ncbi:MAG: NfeD family protein [Elusimicrobia bacterium]|nr:NfeD family protein [Elusimicrobiota bacterium]